jgi:hypothetical protein
MLTLIVTLVKFTKVVPLSEIFLQMLKKGLHII